MADSSTPGRAAADPMQGVQPNQYMDWFKESPDPWEQITQLEYGADRSFASDIELLVLNSDSVQWPKLEKKLLEALAASTGKSAAINFVCRQLALIGGDASVEPLSTLLKDPSTTDAARIALQPNPSPAVNAALRGALDVLTGDKLCGLIGTIAARHDTDAIPALERIASDSGQPESVRETAKNAIAQLR
jgi:hypothetical protein